MCWDDWDGAPGIELGGLEGSGAYIICKIGLPVQSVRLTVIIIIFFSWPMLLFSNSTFDFTVQAIRNITFTNSREFVRNFSKFIKNYEFRTNFVYKVHLRIRVRIRENKRKNSYANLNFERRK